MATLITGTQVAQLTTPSQIWQSYNNTPDTGENNFYFFRNNGDLYRTTLPGLASPVLIGSYAHNKDDIMFMINDPASASYLILLDRSEGLFRVSVADFSLTLMLSISDFNTATSTNFSGVCNIARVCPNGTILLAGEADANGTTWRLNPATSAITEVKRMGGLMRAMCPGLSQNTDVIRVGYTAPYLFCFNVNSLDEFQLIAGTGADGDVLGNVFTAQFQSDVRAAWITPDQTIIYISTGAGLRYVQGSTVGAISLNGTRVCYLPVNNLFLTMGAQDITLYS
jgi:hypothetical protein